jgi:hypothetical protein
LLRALPRTQTEVEAVPGNKPSPEPLSPFKRGLLARRASSGCPSRTAHLSLVPDKAHKAEACPEGAVTHSADYRLSTRTREDLVVRGTEELRLARALEGKLHRLFGRSLKLRQVSAGGCNGCESDANVLSTVGWDLSRFGIQIVASPRHADGLLSTYVSLRE